MYSNRGGVPSIYSRRGDDVDGLLTNRVQLSSNPSSSFGVSQPIPTTNNTMNSYQTQFNNINFPFGMGNTFLGMLPGINSNNISSLVSNPNTTQSLLPTNNTININQFINNQQLQSNTINTIPLQSNLGINPLLTNSYTNNNIQNVVPPTTLSKNTLLSRALNTLMPRLQHCKYVYVCVCILI